MQGFVEAYDQFVALDTQIIGVSVDPWPAANAFAGSLGADFPLLETGRSTGSRKRTTSTTRNGTSPDASRT